MKQKERHGFALRGYHLHGNCCPKCEAPIAGRWHTDQTRAFLQPSQRAQVRRVALSG